MRLPFHPRPGTVLVCDYSTGFKSPEMVKRRLAVSISPKLKRREGLVTVVPLSQSPPTPVEAWHHRVDFALPPPWGPGPRWAKCDMLATVGFERLTLPFTKNAQTGARRFVQVELPDEVVAALRAGIAAAVGLAIEL